MTNPEMADAAALLLRVSLALMVLAVLGDGSAALGPRFGLKFLP